jgi:hypothetical protein
MGLGTVTLTTLRNKSKACSLQAESCQEEARRNYSYPGLLRTYQKNQPSAALLGGQGCYSKVLLPLEGNIRVGKKIYPNFHVVLFNPLNA